jgi:Cu/Ag efflux pump CusA
VSRQEDTGEIRFTIYRASDILYYSAEYLNPISSGYDLLRFEMPYTNYLTGTTGTIPLYEVLSDECFLKDENGEVILAADGIPQGIQLTPAYSKVAKINGLRYQTITLYLADGYGANKAKTAITKALNGYYKNNRITEGVSYGYSSSTAIVDEIFSTLYFVLGLGIVFIYLVMVAQFRSLKDPFIILFTIPLAFTGSIFALFVAGIGINIMGLMALIVLAGVVVNNGIVFIDYVNRLTDQGMPIRDAIMKTAHDRVRPILMTALTTIIALLVMAFDGSEAASILRPLGVASIGGLTYATFLTLIVVPVLVSIFKKKPKKGKKRKGLFTENYEYFRKNKI